MTEITADYEGLIKALDEEDYSVLPILADYLEEMGDERSKYLRGKFPSFYYTSNGAEGTLYAVSQQRNSNEVWESFRLPDDVFYAMGVVHRWDAKEGDTKDYWKYRSPLSKMILDICTAMLKVEKANVCGQ